MNTLDAGNSTVDIASPAVQEVKALLWATRSAKLGRVLINGRLFTHDFLLVGIQETAQWRAVDDATLSARARTSKAMLDVVSPHQVIRMYC